MRSVNDVRQRLPAFTNGEGLWVSYPDGDVQVTTEPPPSRPRTDGNPVDRAEYLRFLAMRRG